MTLRWRLRRAWRVFRGTAWTVESLEWNSNVIRALRGSEYAHRFLRELHELAAISTSQYHQQLKRLGLEEG